MAAAEDLGPDFAYQRVVFRCSCCNHPINDGSCRLWSGRFDAPRGEFR